MANALPAFYGQMLAMNLGGDKTFMIAADVVLVSLVGFALVSLYGTGQNSHCWIHGGGASGD